MSVKGKENEAEISAVLDLLMYMDADIMQSKFMHPEKKSISDIINYIDNEIKNKKLSFNKTQLDDFENIKNIVRNNENIYGSILLATSSNTQGYGFEELIAATFIDTRPGKQNDVYIAFRGTGDGKWPANAEGLTTEMSVLQANALAYAERVLHMYHSGATNVIATGHSQGGNLAQYITLFSSREITCFSIDGQGQSAEALEKFRKMCEANGWDYETKLAEITSRMYAINGENDPVNFFGIKIIPELNTFYILTPNAKEFGDFHDIKFMFNETGLNWTRDAGGEIINGEMKALAKFAQILSEKMLQMNPELLDATAYSAMSILERFMKYNTDSTFHQLLAHLDFTTGTVGNQLFVTPEQWLIFLKEGLPIILETVTSHPELLIEILSYLEFESPVVQGLIDAIVNSCDPKTAETLLEFFSDIILMIPPEILAQATSDMLFNGGKIDFKMIMDSITAEQLEELLKKHLPKLTEALKDNPELLGEILQKFGIDLPPWAVNMLAGFIHDVISWLPMNIIADAIKTYQEKGLLAALPALIAAAFATIVAAATAAIKQLAIAIIDKIKEEANKIINGIKDAFGKGADFIGGLVNGFVDTVGGIADAGLKFIGSVSQSVAAFGADVLGTLQSVLPPQFAGVFDALNGVVSFIDGAVQKAAEMGRTLISSIKEGLKNIVGKAVDGAKGVVNAVGDFVAGAVSKTLETVKDLTSSAIDTIGSVNKKTYESLWEAGKYVWDSVKKAAEKTVETISERVSQRQYENIFGTPFLKIISEATKWIFKTAGGGPRPVGMPVPSVAGVLLNNIKMAFARDDALNALKQIDELIAAWSKNFVMLDTVFNAANKAVWEHNKANVKEAANAVSSLAANIKHQQNDALRELQQIRDALKLTINDYQNLELSFA
ncbi:MAG: DUF2974 domain-containing protein [Defluviitaleaceae bacterium]|nr:DUF2974 domain-containing protein [Defluviitaleaceae bacterium]